MGNLKYIRLVGNKITDEQFNQILAVEQSEGEGYSEEAVRQIYVETENNINFACFDGDRIVGHIATNPQSKRRNGSIYTINLVVLPEYRRMGIAQNLIYTACKYSLDNKCQLPTSLQVDKDNQPAINLYKKVGYEIKEPICEADEDDEQYIMVSSLENVCLTIENLQESENE